jgi:nitronate monooxygenase
VLDQAMRESLVLPAVVAPMTMVSGRELVTEACRAGIMAGLPRHNFPSSSEFATALTRIRADLERHSAEHPGARVGPLAVNISTRRPVEEIREDLDICAAHGVQVVISSLGNPAELAKIVHDWGGQIYHDVTTLRFAEKATTAGVDGLICITSGGGGHSGLLSPFVFIPAVREFFDGTIVLAGGISTGAALRAAEVLGADLSYLGTRFIATREANVPQEYREMLVNATAADLLYTDRVSAVPANWLVPSLRSRGLDPADLPMPAGRGNYDHLPAGVRPWREIWSAGQGVELIHDAPPVAEVVARLRQEYRAAASQDAPGY